MGTFICGFMNAFPNILLMLIMLIPDGGTMMVVQCSVLLVLVLNEWSGQVRTFCLVCMFFLFPFMLPPFSLVFLPQIWMLGYW